MRDRAFAWLPALRKWIVRRGPDIAAAVALALLVVAALWPLSWGADSHVTDYGDPLLNSWVLEWERIALTEGFALWDPPIFHPALGALAFSENLLGILPFYATLRALGLTPIGAHNWLVVLGLALSAVTAFCLARELEFPRLAAMVAGLVFALAPLRLDHLPHLQICWTPWIPLAFVFLKRAFEGKPRNLWWAGLALAATLLSSLYLGAFTLIVWSVAAGLAACVWPNRLRGLAPHALAIGVLIGGIGAWLAQPYETAKKTYGMVRERGEIIHFSLVPASLLAPGGWLPHYAFLAPFNAPERNAFPGIVTLVLAATGIWALRRGRSAKASPREGTGAVGIELESLRLPHRPHRHDWPSEWIAALDLAVAGLAAFTLGSIATRWLASIHPYSKGATLPFLVLLGLAALRLGLRCGRDTGALAREGTTQTLDRGSFTCGRCILRNWPAGPWFAILSIGGIAALWLAFGPRALLYESLATVATPLNSIRAASRAAILALLPLGLLAACGMRWFAERTIGWSHRALPLGLAALLWLDYRAAPLDLAAFDPHLPPIYQALRRNKESGVLLELPFEGYWPGARPAGVYGSAYPQYWQSWHRRPTVNGYSGFFTPDYLRLRDDLEEFPSLGTIAALRRLGVRFIALHPEAFERQAWKRFVRRSRAYDGDGIEYIGEFEHGRARDWLFRLQP